MMAATVPVLAILVVVYGLYKRIDVFEAFIEGAKEGLPLLLRILPYMAGMLIAIQLLRGSGILDWICNLLAKPLSALGMPAELLPMVLLRPLSGSAAMAIVADLMAQYGADSFIGIAAATMMGSSETIFYTLAVYFGSVGIQKTRFTVPVAIIASLISVSMSILHCSILLKF